MTTASKQRSSFAEIVSELILLERDATAAYVRILARLDGEAARENIRRLVGIRQERLAELTKISFTLRSTMPDEATASTYLPTGRITLAGLKGDAAILAAMRAGEDETVAAYERACAHPQATPKSRQVFERALGDALEHRAWAEEAAKAAREAR